MFSTSHKCFGPVNLSSCCWLAGSIKVVLKTADSSCQPNESEQQTWAGKPSALRGLKWYYVIKVDENQFLASQRIQDFLWSSICGRRMENNHRAKFACKPPCNGRAVPNHKGGFIIRWEWWFWWGGGSWFFSSNKIHCPHRMVRIQTVVCRNQGRS